MPRARSLHIPHLISACSPHLTSPHLKSFSYTRDAAPTGMFTCPMDDTTQRTAHRITILDLPKEILLEIFGHFVEKFPTHDPSQYYKPRDSEASDRLTLLGNNRLVCRAVDNIISPLLCPVVGVWLCSRPIERLEGLFRNPLIAQGVRGIAISLLFRPRAIATDFKRYHMHANSILLDLERECDWNTEFQYYDQDDMSDDAITWREYHDAWSKIGQMQSAWRELIEGSTEKTRLKNAEIREEEDQENQKINKDDADQEDERGKDIKQTQAILTVCFDKYAAAHEEQAHIVSDGSFVRSVTRALSSCGSLPFVWFNEDQPGTDLPVSHAITLLNTEEALIHELIQGHEWLKIESTLCKDDDDTELFLPASVLTGLPIACHDAGVPLRGISVDSFPLLRGYRCLLPGATQTDDRINPDPWARFAAACHDLKIFNFGNRGMSCSPVRPGRQSTSDSAIINGFIGAAISGPHLQRLYLSMTPFRVRSGFAGEKGKEHSYLASPILATITSTQLRSIVLHTIDICEQDLLALVKSASPVHLTYFYIASVTLSRGHYANAMGLLREIVLLKRNNNGSVPKIHFNTLQGAEFGGPSTFDDSGYSWMFGSTEERELFWDKLEQHQHPDLLKQVEQWVMNGKANEVNPLLALEPAQHGVSQD
ncbi:hypothetical protein PMIN06_011359 [Paraphaeosphaeria minitans]